MYKIFIFIFSCFLFFSFSSQSSAKEIVDVYFFYGNGCPHCAKEEKFLNNLKQENENIKINSFEVWHDAENIKFLTRIVRELNLETYGIPLLIIGDKTFVGFYNEETTGKQIKLAIDYYLENECVDLIKPIINQEDSIENQAECAQETDLLGEINIPILGEVAFRDLSLPIFTILVAAIDGFNPCAMWVLLFLISLLLGMEDRKRMWILGSVFIFSSGFVYFLFLSAWLNLFLFLGFVIWIRILIGITALASGIYHLREYRINKEGVCKVSGGEKRRLIFEKLRMVSQKKNIFFATLGIIILAFAVNLVELVCSAGLPAVYTNVLSLSNLPKFQHYFYLILYIFIFMLDDLFVFLIAMTTLKIKAISSRYTRWSGLVGGIILVIIGILLLFKPGWIMFG
ncbi:MAG: hypothetical protein ABIA02_02605 [Candidatus Falkowbacteria bacterium]